MPALKRILHNFWWAASAALLASALQAQIPDTLLHSIPPPSIGIQSEAQLGFSVAMDGNYTVAGAPYDDNGAYDAGVVKVFNTTTGALLFVLPNPSPATSDQFGSSVAISGNRVVVGAYQDNTGATNAGSAYVYDLTSGTPTVPIATLPNPNPAAEDRFGSSVAISGTRVVVGAYLDAPLGIKTGSAYVYDLTSGTPTVPVTTLNKPGPASIDNFGYSVAISGTRLVVGAYRGDTGASDAGSAYVYDLTSATPAVPTATLNNPTPAADDQFGFAVAISGIRVVVGARFDDTGATDSGSAYAYDLTSATPTVPTATLNNPGPAASDYFGWSVAISGTRVVVGARSDDTGATDSGSAYVYDLTNGTPTVPTVTQSNPSPANSDSFGNAVAISGTRVVVGAYFDSTGATTAGSAYVYELTGGTPAIPIATLNHLSPSVGDSFSYSTAISGTLVVIGASGDDTAGLNAGSAFVYDLASATPTVPVTTLSNPNPASNDAFGYSVAISGSRVVVGAFGNDTGAFNAGSAYVYDLTSATPTVPVVTLPNPSPGNGDRFGYSVSISGTLVVIGADADYTEFIDNGSAFVYDLASATPTVPIATLNNPSPAEGDFFGSSVAIAGTRVVVGASADDTGAINAGSAYVYDLTSATPTIPTTTLNNPSLQNGEGDFFGWSVSISGTRVVVGSPFGGTIGPDPGIAYVYDLTSATPAVPSTTLSNPSPVSADEFGYAVAISGSRIVVGAARDDTGATDAGTAYVYDLTSANPTIPLATLNNPGPASGDYFGNSVSISGTTVAIGTPSDDTVLIDKGYAYIYGPVPLIDIAVAQASQLTDGGSVPFGTQNLGTSSLPLTFTITNTGNVPLTNLALTGGTSEFIVSSLSATSIPAGPGTVTFTVTFHPTVAGDRTATLHLASNVTGTKNPFDIVLTGTGVNLPPTFSGYTLQAFQNMATILPLSTLLTRAADADGGNVSVPFVSSMSSQNGSVSLGTINITYTPPLNFTGLDTFGINIIDGQGGNTLETVMVSVSPAGTQIGNQPLMSIQPGGSVAMLFVGTPGQSYRLERSTDMQTWTPLQTSVAPADGTLPYLDRSPPTQRVYYRSVPL